MSADIKTLRLGHEYDEDLIKNLDVVLEKMGGVLVHNWSAVVGSQELLIKKIRLGELVLDIESETYIGLSIRGPKDLVDTIANALQNR